MKINTLIFIIFFSLFSFSYSLTIEEIKNSNEYCFGKGISASEEKAKDSALKTLLEAIVPVAVETSFERKTLQTTKDAFKSEAKDFLKTYAFEPSLEGVETILNRNEYGDFVCFKYIKKSEIAKIYSRRKEQISSFYNIAKKYEKEANYKDALKFYYYSLVLFKTVPSKYLSSKENLLNITISDTINKIINNTKLELISFKQVAEKEREFLFSVKTFGKDVSQMELSYWDGTSNISVLAKDGKLLLSFFGSKDIALKKTRVMVTYIFYKDSEQFQTVKASWDYIKLPRYGTPKKIILDKNVIKEQENIQVVTNVKMIATESNLVFEEKSKKNIKKNIKNSINDFISLMESKNRKERIASISDVFLRNKISSIFKHNDTKLISSKNANLKIRKTSDGWEARKLAVLNRYPAIRLKSFDYLVLDFSKEGNLTDLNFAVNENLYKVLEERSKKVKNWDEISVLIKFLEKYRTSYLIRDIGMIKKIFSDNALIIVGRILKKDETLQDVGSYKYKKIGKDQPSIEYLKFTKKEYIKRQTAIFKQNKNIHLGFSTFNIFKKNRNENVYELSMKQNYRSDRYADEGYLFLLIDFKKMDAPKIYVRAWQPNEWDEEKLLSMDNFEIVKPDSVPFKTD